MTMNDVSSAPVTSHEIWAAAQLATGESVEDGVARIAVILARAGERISYRRALEQIAERHSDKSVDGQIARAALAPPRPMGDVPRYTHLPVDLWEAIAKNSVWLMRNARDGHYTLDQAIEYQVGAIATGRDPAHMFEQAAKLDRTAPERVYLQVDGDGDNAARDEAFPDFADYEVTWFAQSQGGLEVEYVRADLAQLRPVGDEAAKDAEIARLRRGWDQATEALDAESAHRCEGVSSPTGEQDGEVVAPMPPRLAEKRARPESFQARVSTWMDQCFQPSLYSNVTERGDRLLEEVLELLQSKGYDRNRVATLVDYVYGRPAGEPSQEVGGVMVTLAGYCWIAGLDMHADGERELSRIAQAEVMAKIRAKQESKNALRFDTPIPGEAQPRLAGVLDGWKPNDSDVRAWMERNDIPDSYVDQWRMAIDDARSMHLLADAAEVPRG